MGRARILVVEDEPVVATDLAQELTSLGYSVVGTAVDAEMAVQMADVHRPTLVLMDIHLEGVTDGIEAAEQIRHRFGIPIVYLTAYADEETLHRAKATEPLAYLVKPFHRTELHATITVALHRYEQDRKRSTKTVEFSDALSAIDKVLQRAGAATVPSGGPSVERFAEVNDLSPREKDVFVCLSGGASVKKIAEALGISPQTVRNHLKAIFQKLHVHSQVELISKFQRGVPW